MKKFSTLMVLLTASLLLAACADNGFFSDSTGPSATGYEATSGYNRNYQHHRHHQAPASTGYQTGYSSEPTGTGYQVGSQPTGTGYQVGSSASSSGYQTGSPVKRHQPDTTYGPQSASGTGYSAGSSAAVSVTETTPPPATGYQAQ